MSVSCSVPHRTCLLLLVASVTCLPAVLSAQGTAKASDDSLRDEVAAVLTPDLFAVPDAPAFELLPNKPSEVTHLAEPTDFSAHIDAWHNGDQLVAGVALDARPFVNNGGSLSDYQNSNGRRMLFRTILSAGTAKAVTGPTNVLAALGLRVPIFDGGDPRADSSEQSRLATAYNKAKELVGEPAFPVSPVSPDTKRRTDSMANVILDSLRAAYAAKHWNAVRFVIGLAGSALVQSAALTPDSVTTQAGGAWAALAFPLGQVGGPLQVTIAGKESWSRPDTVGGETRRASAGVSLLAHLGNAFALSAEYSYVSSVHRQAPQANDQWSHLALLSEWYIASIKGWLGVSYGGDSGRAANHANQFGLHYAIYHDRILK